MLAFNNPSGAALYGGNRPGNGTAIEGRGWKSSTSRRTGGVSLLVQLRGFRCSGSIRVRWLLYSSVVGHRWVVDGLFIVG